MSNQKRVLGRGLADLIPVGGNADGASSTPPQELPIAQLHPNPGQPRTFFDEGALEELAASIRANGILQPILVRPRPAAGYEIVAGERRYRAALKAGLIRVPVIIKTLTDEETLAIALIENLIREDISPLEEARAFHRLMTEFGWTQEEMGKRVGKSRPAIANSLRLLELPDPIQKSLEEGEMSEGHARALLGDRKSRERADFQEHQERVWQEIIAQKLSVREVEKRMEEAPKASSVTPRANKVTTPGLAEWVAIEDQLREALGTRVRLAGTPDKGRIEIEFFSQDELSGLLERLMPPAQTTPAPRRTGRIEGLLSRSRDAA
jgi:ParB family chromosome partitioning protein